MKSIVLFVSVLLVTLPVFGEVTLKEVERIVTDANDKQTAELKEYVNLKTEPIQEDVSFVRNWQTTLVTASMVVLVTLLPWSWKKSSDERREHSEAMVTQQAEIAALRAENERLRNASRLVSPSGGRLETDSAGEG